MKNRISLKDIELISKYNSKVDIDKLHIFESNSEVIDNELKSDLFTLIKNLKFINLKIYCDYSYFYIFNKNIVLFFNIENTDQFVYTFEDYSIAYLKELSKKDTSIYKKTFLVYLTWYSKLGNQVAIKIIKSILNEKVFSYTINSIRDQFNISLKYKSFYFYITIHNDYQIKNKSILQLSNSVNKKIITNEKINNIREPILTFLKDYGIDKSNNKIDYMLDVLEINLY